MNLTKKKLLKCDLTYISSIFEIGYIWSVIVFLSVPNTASWWDIDRIPPWSQGNYISRYQIWIVLLIRCDCSHKYRVTLQDFLLPDISSVECIKSESAFSSFCRKTILCSDFLCISLLLNIFFLTLSWYLHYGLKCVILTVTLISVKDYSLERQVSAKAHFLRTDDMTFGGVLSESHVTWADHAASIAKDIPSLSSSHSRRGLPSSCTYLI